LELHNLYALSYIIRLMNSVRMRFSEHAARNGNNISAYSVLVLKPEGKRPLGKHTQSWEIIL